MDRSRKGKKERERAERERDREKYVITLSADRALSFCLYVCNRVFNQ